MKKITLFIFSIISSIAVAQQFNQISDINPGNPSSGNGNFTQLNNDLIFTATLGNWWVGPYGIYKSDGTSAGTSLVMNIEPHNDNFFNEELFVKGGGNLFFKVKTYQSGYTYKLWKTDGTTGGTLLVKDLDTKEYCSNLCEMDGLIYFITNHLDNVWGNSVHELWKSDGTISGTTVVKDWTNSSLGNSINIIEYNNKIYFSGNESDGTLPGTIQTGVVLPSINNSCVLNGLIYYRGSDSKLWKTDGTITGTVQAVDFPVYGSLYTSNGWIYFSGGYNGVGLPGSELCKTDGTLVNTSMIKDIYFGFNSSYPNRLIDINGTIFFLATDGLNGQELWKTDGTSLGTVLVKDMNPGIGSGSYEYRGGIKHDNQLYFIYNSNSLINRGIWKSDGTALNTVLVQPFDTITAFLEINCTLFLAADNLDVAWPGDYNMALWRDTSNCSSLGFISLNELKQIKISPNPTTSKINVKSSLELIGKKFIIYDQLGKEVKSGIIASENTEIDLSNLTEGIYLFRVGAEMNESFKIIKQ
jgi:ELWxxDGT repeat protein